VVQVWAKKCLRMAVYEHEADSGCARTHCHILMEGCSVKDDQLRKQFYSTLPGEKRKGNDLWSWEHKKWREKHPNVSYNDELLIYMSKGTLAPKFTKDYSPALIEERRLQWVMPISKDVKSSEKYDEYHELCKSYDVAVGKPLTFDEVRHWVFAWYWRRDGRPPHITSYKRNACGVFIRAHEKYGSSESFQSAIAESLNKWY